MRVRCRTGCSHRNFRKSEFFPAGWVVVTNEAKNAKKFLHGGYDAEVKMDHGQKSSTSTWHDGIVSKRETAGGKVSYRAKSTPSFRANGLMIHGASAWAAAPRGCDTSGEVGGWRWSGGLTCNFRNIQGSNCKLKFSIDLGLRWKSAQEIFTRSNDFGIFWKVWMNLN